MSEKPILIVTDTTRVICKACKGTIREDSHNRTKTSSCDKGKQATKYDFHESCWAEAIEVEV